jgi:chemotaxis protein CheZ
MAKGQPPAPEVTTLAERLELLRARHGDRVPIGAIGEVVEGLMGSLKGDPSAEELGVYGELEALARYIARAKEEIGALRPDEIRTRHLPDASGELDAIGSHLEQATGEILDAVEGIEHAAGEFAGEPAARIGQAVTRIYEACNFQDLSGQRIAKVVTALQHIEGRIEAMIRAFEPLHTAAAPPQGADPPPPLPDETPREADARLLNGPQRPQVANSQADIDALLASLE